MSVIALIVIGALLMYRHQAHKPHETPVSAPAPRAGLGGSGKFHAVSIRVGPTACRAAEHLRGHRFLSDAAPALPLDECDACNCKCRFIHHADRRDGDDRRSPFQSGFGGSAARVSEDRRDKHERRVSPQS